MKEAKENLLAVLNMLRAVPDDQFNMEHWWLADGMAFDEERNLVYRVSNGPCGCVVGHCIQNGLLDAGVIDNSELTKEPHYQDMLPMDLREAIFVRIADELELYNYKVAEFLFDQYAYITAGAIKKEDVIRRIEFVISEIEHHEVA